MPAEAIPSSILKSLPKIDVELHKTKTRWPMRSAGFCLGLTYVVLFVSFLVTRPATSSYQWAMSDQFATVASAM